MMRLALAVIMVLVFVPSLLLAQTAAPQRDEPTTKFEKVLLTKGSLGIREYYSLGYMAGRGGSADFEIGSFYAPGSPNRTSALRITVKEGGRLERERIGVLDREEVISLNKVIPQMMKMAETLKQGQKDSEENGSTEVVFSGGSLRFTAFVGRRRDEGLVIQAGSIAPTQALFGLTDLTRVGELIEQAITKMQALDQKK